MLRLFLMYQINVMRAFELPFIPDALYYFPVVPPHKIILSGKRNMLQRALPHCPTSLRSTYALVVDGSTVVHLASTA
jgi:hypothetical protein